MKNQLTSGGGLFGDIFGTGQGAGGFDFQGLLNDPMLQFGLTTLANNGDVSKGIQQALIAGQLQSRNARDAKRDERDNQRFEWEAGDHARTLEREDQWSNIFNPQSTTDGTQPALGSVQGGGGEHPMLAGLSPQERALVAQMPPEAGRRYLLERMNRPQFETVQNPYGRGGVGQRNSQTGQLSGYQAPRAQTPETFGDPTRVVGEDGQEQFVRFGNRGGQMQVNGGLAPAPDHKEVGEMANKLRDDFNSVTKDYRSVEDAYTRIIRSGENPSPAGDLSLIFNYMKLLDPGSVVRESEFRTAGEAGSLPTRVQAAFNKVQTGELLAPEQRADFMGRAASLYQGQTDNYDQYATQYTSMAERMGLNPEDVVVRLNHIEAPTNLNMLGGNPGADNALINKYLGGQ